MDASQSSSGQGFTTEPTFVHVIEYTRNPEIWGICDLIELSNESQKVHCNFCRIYLEKEPNSNLKNQNNKAFCKTLKTDPESQQTQMDTQGGIFNYDLNRVQIE
ncbi:hypothetical protein R6Q57_019724 [Mikania cordata]